MKTRIVALALSTLCLIVRAAGDAATTPLANGVVSSAEAITIPQMMSYQGKLTDTFDIPVADTTYSVTFRLYDVPSGGSPSWNETQTVRTRGGLFSTLLGSVTPIGSVPDAGAAYLAMSVSGGAELTPRLRIASAAYSYLASRAADADLLQGKDTIGLDVRYVNETQADAVTSAMVVDGTIAAADLNQMGASSGQVIKWTGSPNPIADSGTVGFDTTWGDARFVNEAQANSVTGAMITDGQVASADIRDTTVNTGDLKDAAVTMPKLNQAGATSGQVIKWTGSAWTPGNDSGGGSGTVRKVVQATGVVCSPNPIADSGTVRFDSTWGDARFVNEGQPAGGDLTGTYPSPMLASSGVSAGTYGSATQVGQVTVNAKGQLTSAANVSISGVPPGGAAGGGLTGTYPNPTIAADAVSSGNIVDGSIASADIRDTTVNTADIKDAAVTAPKLNQMGATSGQVLKWTGSAWAPGNDSGGGSGTVRKVVQATGVVCSPNPIADSGTVRFDTTWGDARFVNEAQANSVTGAMIADGQVSSADIRDTTVNTAELKDGAVTSAKILDATVTSADIRDTTVNTTDIKGAAVTAPKLNQMGATTNQVLKWTGSAWAPANDSVGTGGDGVTNVYQDTGIICVPNPITSTGNVKLDLAYSDARYVNEAQANSVTGAMITDGQVTSADIRDTTVNTADMKDAAVTMPKLNQAGATSGQVIKWTGSAWALAQSDSRLGYRGLRHDVGRCAVRQRGAGELGNRRDDNRRPSRVGRYPGHDREYRRLEGRRCHLGQDPRRSGHLG
jgi:uncharacterized protein YjbI with pentapeptide repeats